MIVETDRGEPFVGLTARGGAFWEELVRPNWDGYVEEVGRPEPSGHGFVTCITAATERVLHEYLELMRAADPRAEPSAVQTLRDWPATYWKTLPHGFAVTFPDLTEACAAHTDLARWLRLARAELGSRWRELPIV